MAEAPAPSPAIAMPRTRRRRDDTRRPLPDWPRAGRRRGCRPMARPARPGPIRPPAIRSRASANSDEVAQLVQDARADDLPLTQLVDGREGLLCARIDDLLGGDRPTPGSSSSSAAVALFRSTSPPAGRRAPRRLAGRRAPIRLRPADRRAMGRRSDRHHGAGGRTQLAPGPLRIDARAIAAGRGNRVANAESDSTCCTPGRTTAPWNVDNERDPKRRDASSPAGDPDAAQAGAALDGDLAARPDAAMEKAPSPRAAATTEARPSPSTKSRSASGAHCP